MKTVKMEDMNWPDIQTAIDDGDGSSGRSH